LPGLRLCTFVGRIRRRRHPAFLSGRQRQLVLLNVFCQPLGHARLLLSVQPHTFFRTAPQRIFRTTNPFVIDQIFQLGLIKLMAKVFT